MHTNPEILLAEQYVNTTNTSLFLTGKAGTGKTTFLRNTVAHVRKRCVVLAPTGVAAVNAGGVTIHSFFQLPFCPYLPDVPELVTEYQLPDHHKQLRRAKIDIIRTLELLIIDEISMVRADLLDAVDATLRRYRRDERPFGGVQLLMIGDLQQLPPVVTDEEKPYMERVYPSPFFFHAKALRRLPYITIQLQTIYRQQDAAFVRLLNNIRDNRFDAETLSLLNARLDPSAKEAGRAPADEADGTTPIRLTTHNYQANRVNLSRMDALDGREAYFHGRLEGNFPEGSVATDVELRLKVGAQVMFVKNDTSGAHRYYNGKIGKIVDFREETDEEGYCTTYIYVRDTEGAMIRVGRERWENLSYEIDPANNQIRQKVDGTYTQFPLRPAWAITIHKAQGLTFDRVVVDAASAFSFGQVYVALSRCRTLEGLTLVSPISASCAFDCSDISQFNQSMPTTQQVSDSLAAWQQRYTYDLLSELFDCAALQPLFGAVNRLYQNELRMLFPRQSEKCSALIAPLFELVSVGRMFQPQIAQLLQSADAESMSQEAALPDALQQRVRQGAQYFFDHLTTLEGEVEPLLEVDVDNKATAKALAEAAENLRAQLGLKLALLQQVRQAGFTVERYQKIKVDYLLRREKASPRPAVKLSGAYADNAHPKLIPILMRWRKEVADEYGVAAFQIITQKSLLEIADKLPKNEGELLRIKGIGKQKVKMYGADLLRLLARYCDEHGIDFPRPPEIAF